MAGRSFVVIRTEKEALHCWPSCPFPEVSFLKDPHRHKFFIEVWVETTLDREVEFIMLKTEVDQFLAGLGYDLGSTSCEVLAERLADRFNASKVSVFEDNENGAVYERI